MVLSAQVTNGPCGEADDDADPEAESEAPDEAEGEASLAGSESLDPHALSIAAPANVDAEMTAVRRLIFTGMTPVDVRKIMGPSQVPTKNADFKEGVLR